MRSAAKSLFIGHSLPDQRLGFQRIHGRKPVYTSAPFAKAEHNAASLIARRTCFRAPGCGARLVASCTPSDGILQPGSECMMAQAARGQILIAGQTAPACADSNPSSARRARCPFSARCSANANWRYTLVEAEQKGSPKKNFHVAPNGGFQDRASWANLSKAAKRDVPRSRSFQCAALVLSASEHSEIS